MFSLKRQVSSKRFCLNDILICFVYYCLGYFYALSDCPLILSLLIMMLCLMLLTSLSPLCLKDLISIFILVMENKTVSHVFNCSAILFHVNHHPYNKYKFMPLEIQRFKTIIFRWYDLSRDRLNTLRCPDKVHSKY